VNTCAGCLPKVTGVQRLPPVLAARQKSPPKQLRKENFWQPLRPINAPRLFINVLCLVIVICSFVLIKCMSRPLLEYNSVVWSPSTIHDIETIENMQRRFTKRIPWTSQFFFLQVTFTAFKLTKPEHRRLLTDLVWCYKLVFGLVIVNTKDFEFSTVTQTRCHRYKLFKKSNSIINIME